MNTRAVIVFLAFVIWGLISWRWYTHGVKGFYALSYADLTPSLINMDPETDMPSAESAFQYVEEQEGMTRIFFPYKSTPGSFQEQLEDYLGDLGKELRTEQGTVRVVGHTDHTGSENYNLRLGLERATVVADILKSHGVDSDRIKVESRGELEPLLEAHEDQAESKNRRVEIQFMN